MVDDAALNDIIWQSAKEVFETMIFLRLAQSEQIAISTSELASITFMGPFRPMTR
jgi:hypothetical protein